MKKKGIALISIVVVVLIISILTGTIAGSAYKNIKKSELRDFAKEIKTVEDFFGEYTNSNSGQIPVKANVVVNVAGKESVFAGEKIVNSTVNLYKIDLDKIGLHSLHRGNEKTPDDVYLYSETTKKIYYSKGVQNYYTLTKNLYDKLGIKDVSVQMTTQNLQDGIIIKANKNLNNWINSLDKFELKVPFNANVTPNVRSSNSYANIISKGLQNGVYVFEVTPVSPLRNFDITIEYADSIGARKNYVYSINKVDTVKPKLDNMTINKIKENGKTKYQITNVNPVENESGIYKLKYTNKKVSVENAKEYFSKKGEDIKNGMFTVSRSLDPNITVYCEDRAGNYIVSYLEKEKRLKPGEPLLTNDLIPIKWVNNNSTLTEVNTTQNDSDWYNYDQKKWPNAKTERGDYFVWIPRFEYKITYYTNSSRSVVSQAKTIYPKVDINIIDVDKIIPTPGYKIHPAFRDGTNDQFKNGEWDREIPGFWFAKFEATETTDSVGVEFKPNKAKGEKRSVEDKYNNSFNYMRELDSHMAKNSEWGAVCIFGYSEKYGNGPKPIIDKYDKTGNIFTVNSSKITTVSASNSSIGGTTNTVYGIFDLTACLTEVVSSYAPMDIEFAKNYGPSLVNPGRSTKYVTVYPYNKTNNTSQTNYEEYLKTGIYGDGIGEFTIKMGESGTVDNKKSIYPAYYSETASSPKYPAMFFARGGLNQDNIKQFSSITSTGVPYNNIILGTPTKQTVQYSYRVVLIPEM